MTDPTPPVPETKTFTQEQVNEIFSKRWAEEKSKIDPQLKEYEELKTFKAEHEKQGEAQKQKELEAAKEYEKIKETYEGKIADYTSIVTQKDKAISDMKINTSLMTEITKQNAYPEETLALLQGQTVLGDDGVVKISGKDANGMDTQLTVEAGVKQFLEARPHLAKVNARPGGGTPPSMPSQSGGSPNISQLNEDYRSAQASGDYKRAAELKGKIQQSLTSQGVRRN